MKKIHRNACRLSLYQIVKTKMASYVMLGTIDLFLQQL